MLHEPAAKTGTDLAADYKRDLGMKMFVFYALFYVGFVAINVISPVLMENEIIFGMNLACTYGFALILVALIMALIYNHMCTKKETLLNIGDLEQPSALEAEESQVQALLKIGKPEENN